MLRSEINELEKSIGAILEDKGTANPNGYRKRLTEQVEYVKNLCAELKKKWTQELLRNAKEQVIKRYVQFHQAGIIQLSDAVSHDDPGFNFPEEAGNFKSQLYQDLNAALENVLDFLCQQFYPYFDKDHSVSIYHSQQLVIKIATFESELQKYQSANVDRSLISCVLTSANDVLTEALVAGISYRQAEQCLNLVRMTHQLLRFGSKTTTETLTKALYQQNFNSLHFFHWYQDRLRGQLGEHSDKKDQRDLIDYQIRNLSGIFVNPEKTLQPELPSTDVLLLPWLQEQLGSEPSVRAKPVFQLPLNLSVPQFALFVRIFYKSGCFPLENVALITRFFTEHFTTKKQPHISQKSFGRAFYNLDQSAAAVVRDYLQKMLNYLNKTYFP